MNAFAASRDVAHLRGSRAGAILGLLVMLGALGAVRVVNAVRADNIARDGCIYLRMAKDFGERPPVEVIRAYDYHPAYSAVVGWVARMLGANWPEGWTHVGRGVSIFFSLVGLVGVFIIALRTFGRHVAWLTVLLMGLASTYVELSSDVLSDPQSAGLGIFAIALALVARGQLADGRRIAAATALTAGLLAGLGYLTRPEILLSVVVGATLLVLWVPWKAAPRRKLQAASLALLLAGAAAAALPYMAAIGELTLKKDLGDFASSGGSLPLAMATASVTWLRAFTRMADNLREAAGTPMAVLVICWFATWFGRRVLRLKLPRQVMIMPRRGGAIAMFTPLIVLAAVVMAMERQLGTPHEGYASSRHLLLAAMAVAPCGGAAVLIFVRWTLLLGGKLGLPRKPKLALACWSLGMVCVFATQAFPVLHENKDYHRRVGRTLRRQFGPGQCVFAPNAWVPFFADADRMQFVHRGGLNTTLRSVHLKSPDRLSRAAARTDCDVVYLAVAEQLTDSPVVPRDIIAQILRDRRFRLLGTFASSRRDKIWLFEWMRRFETSTQPAAGAALP